MKETLILYKDWWNAIKCLPVEMQAEAFNSVCAYAFEGVMPTDPMTAAVTALMRSAIDRDNEKWEKVREKRRAAIKSRWDKQKAVTEEQMNTDDTNVFTSIQDKQKNTTDTVNVNDNVNVNVNVIKEKRKKKFVSIQNLKSSLKNFAKHIPVESAVTIQNLPLSSANTKIGLKLFRCSCRHFSD